MSSSPRWGRAREKKPLVTQYEKFFERISGECVVKKTARFHLAALVLATGVSSPLLAQTAPSAGQLLRELEKKPLVPAPVDNTELPGPVPVPSAPAAAATSDEKKITVSQFIIRGNQAIPADELLAALEDLRNAPLTLAELQGAAQRITAVYRKKGWLLARAYLPAQEVQGGSVRIEVLEGHYGEVRMQNESGVPDRVVNNALRPLQAGKGVQAGPLENALLSLNDLPGVNAASRLSAGTEVGSSDLDVKVEPGSRYSGNVTLDNYGNTYNGAYRLGAALTLNNPFSLADKGDVSALVSDEGQTYLRGQYELPVGPWNTRLGAAYSWMHYELGQDFEALDVSGSASTATLYAVQSWWRQRASGVSTQLSYDHKELQDETGLFGLNSEKSLNNVTLQFNGYWRDNLLGDGASSYALGWTVGDLSLDSADAKVQDALLHSEGHFQKWTPAILRQQTLGNTFSLLLQARGQLASGNLDASEKISLGGAYGVRAYPEGEASGDEGWVTSLELRQIFSRQWQGGVFVDAGGVRINHNPPAAAGDNYRQLSGAGLAAYWQPDEHWQATLSAALPLSDEDPTSDTPRGKYVWAQLQWRY